MEQHIKYMKEALRQAKKAYALGEVPIGCVIVYEDKMFNALDSEILNFIIELATSFGIKLVAALFVFVVSAKIINWFVPLWYFISSL